MWNNEFSLKHFISSLLVVASGSEATKVKRRSPRDGGSKPKRHTSSAATHDQLKLFLVGSRRTGTVTITSLLEEIGYGNKYHGWYVRQFVLFAYFAAMQTIRYDHIGFFTLNQVAVVAAQ